ncbi:unnamed protein product [Candidula unifasciata]|uniref:Peptidase M20 domain-containing protein 2 n=1 Tax=Candidula unifasciata TaxID=100452 RepID=A0A8S3ZLA9_9EUPU|nr:unnamed protein product [Candidula unifasciata]
MDSLKQIACDAIDKERAHLFELSTEIWHHKELAFEEHKSHATLTQFLEQRGFIVQRHYKLETAFLAQYERPKQSQKHNVCNFTDHKPHIAVLCEYDALPDIGHACGHNLIAELGVAAALGIKAVLDQADEDLGKLSVIGTPAEEGGGGKIDLINAGVFDDVDVAIMAHPAPFTDARPVFIGGKKFYVNYHGKPSHAAGFPWEGVNALDAAVLGYMNIAALRQQLHPSWRVHVIITKGGTKTNIIPDETEMMVQIRTARDSEIPQIEAKVKACLRASAEATGCTLDFVDFPKPYSSLVTNETLAGLYEINGALIGEEFQPVTTKKVLGSTDMGNLSHKLPCLHPTYQCGTEAFNHTREFTAAVGKLTRRHYSHLPLLRQILAMVAVDIFSKPHYWTI